MIKYIGSKRTLLPRILHEISCFDDVRTVLDLFSGTSRVGHALKQAGYVVTANDHNAYAHALACCYVEANRDALLRDVEELVLELNTIQGRAGYVTETFCERSRYLQPHNGARVDAIRDAIDEMDLDPILRSVMIVSLIEAADRVDSTCGLQMAYLKKWSKRSYNDLELRVPEMVSGSGRAWRMEAEDAAEKEPFDLVYLDPPYNQHKYLGNYHVWESIVRWDKPEVYGVACKRIDCKDYQSPFNSKRKIYAAFESVLKKIQAKALLVSFNNEGYLSEEEIVGLLESKGDVVVGEVDYKRYVGAQIGIHNLQGEKVGKVSHLRNRELLFAVRCRR